MNTKSMILALNSLLLFNTVHPRFGISSLRKKIVNICAKLGKKSVSIVCGVALVLLSTFSLKGGYIRSKLRAAHMASQPQFVPQVAPPPDPGPVRDPYQEQLRTRASAALTSKIHRAVPIPFGSFTPTAYSRAGGVFQGHSSHQSTQAAEEDSEEEISSEDEQVPVFPTELCGSCETIKGLVLHYPDRKNLLEQIPIELVQLITQMIHHRRWVHARSFQDQWFHRDDTLAKGEDPKEWPDDKKSTSINFIDGKPTKLELAFHSGYKRIPRGYHGPTVDAITIDTDTYSQTIERGKEVEIINYRDIPTSYHQRGIHALRRTSSQRKPELFTGKTIPGFVPLRQQVNFIDHHNGHMLEWNWDNSSRTTSLGPTTYSRSNYAETYGEELMGLGIQRNLSDGRVIWLKSKGKITGIYEKAMPWYDESGALTYPGFETVLRDRDPDGDKFHLVQVIEEHVPVRTISLPHTPVYLRDKDGKEIEGCCTLPPRDSTAHLRSPLEYPQDLDVFALGFSAEETDTRVSLYKQLGDKPSEYNPRLLLDQLSSTKPYPDRMEMLYPNEHPSVRDYFHYANVSAQVYVATKLRRRNPRQIPAE